MLSNTARDIIGYVPDIDQSPPQYNVRWGFKPGLGYRYCKKKQRGIHAKRQNFSKRWFALTL